jgi:hypothetical protein
VPVEPNRLVKKGELLFRIDPTPYQNELSIAKAKLAVDEAKLEQAGAGLVESTAGAREIARATQVGQRPGHGAAAEARTREVAGHAESRTGGHGGGRQVSRSSRRSQRDRARRPSSRPRPRTRRRSRRSCRDRSTVNRRRSPPRARRSPRRKRRSMPAGSKSRTSSGISIRRPCTRRRAVTRSTCSCGQARSSRHSR